VKVTRLNNAVTDNAQYAGRGHYNFLKISLLVKQPLIMTLKDFSSVCTAYKCMEYIGNEYIAMCLC